MEPEISPLTVPVATRPRMEAFRLPFLLGQGRPSGLVLVGRVTSQAPSLRLLTPLASLLLAVTAAAWVGVVVLARDMGSMPGTMGLGVGSFTAVWALMALLVAFGLMNVIAMVVLAGSVLVEKTWGWGSRFSRLLGITALGLALAVIFAPGLAPGGMGGCDDRITAGLAG
jgi:hypothetical protein